MAVKFNIVLDQGATFTRDFTLNDSADDPLDVTGYTANSMMRKAYSASNAHVFSTNLVNGSITLSMTPAQTANIESGRYVYDVILTTSSNVKTRVIEGVVTVKPGVTR